MQKCREISLRPWGRQIFLRKDAENQKHIQQKQQQQNGKLDLIKIKKLYKLKTRLGKKYSHAQNVCNTYS